MLQKAIDYTVLQKNTKVFTFRQLQLQKALTIKKIKVHLNSRNKYFIVKKCLFEYS